VDERTRDGIVAKFDRAREHLERLYREVDEFIEGKPHHYWAKPDFHAGRYSIHVTVNNEPSVEMSVTCGDFIHCLRSALDQLACAAVPKVTRRTAYPIYNDRDDFFCRVVVPAKRKRDGPLTGLDVTGDLFAAIELTQPYNGPHGLRVHPLFTLAALSNMDKHRAILASAAAQTGDVEHLAVIAKDIDASPAYYETGVPLKNGAKIGWGKLTVTGLEPHMEMHGELPFEVAFGEGDDLAQLEGLEKLRKAIYSIASGFIRQLGGTEPPPWAPIRTF